MAPQSADRAADNRCIARVGFFTLGMGSAGVDVFHGRACRLHPEALEERMGLQNVGRGARHDSSAGDCHSAVIHLHRAQRLTCQHAGARSWKAGFAHVSTTPRDSVIMLWRDGVFHYKRPYSGTLNLSIVGSAGPCYFFCQVGPGVWRKSCFRLKSRCGVNETRVSDCRGSGVFRSPRHKFSRSRECVRPAK